MVTTVINYEEQMRGWMAALNQGKSSASEVRVYARLLEHLATFRRMTVLEYDDAAARIREQIRRKRVRIGAIDAKIASIVLARDAVLVSRNTADFRRIAGLRVEDWTIEGEA